MNTYKVNVTEVLSRTVIIRAEDTDTAYEKVENFCNDGTINLDGSDFVSRNILCNEVQSEELVPFVD